MSTPSHEKRCDKMQFTSVVWISWRGCYLRLCVEIVHLITALVNFCPLTDSQTSLVGIEHFLFHTLYQPLWYSYTERLVFSNLVCLCLLGLCVEPVHFITALPFFVHEIPSPASWNTTFLQILWFLSNLIYDYELYAN